MAPDAAAGLAAAFGADLLAILHDAPWHTFIFPLHVADAALAVGGVLLDDVHVAHRLAAAGARGSAPREEAQQPEAREREQGPERE
eukprot:CAMPEP_0168406948 /NCGR_PEP_ID=MMETSP0228-20121227/25913_1 /TAXON_ID=133427 /ORGANISM="Protoceratium reticulatum, Strain CCCM 535 (=CCMP 1889)" /LENGTH=85 /DNA_ID=CAMNT_0008420609 /DNA_START=71 /DNA_END=326 /DNA_ORIENTATION=+